jgi:hypothetical protein
MQLPFAAACMMRNAPRRVWAATQAANLNPVRLRKLRASETGQFRDNFRQTQPCNGRMALPARQIDRSIPRLTVNKI